MWLIVLLLFGDEFTELRLRQVAVIVIVSEVVIAVMVCRSDPRGTWGFPFLYLLVLIVFHSGLFLSPALFGRLPDALQHPSSNWFSDVVANRAGYLVCIAIACYGIGYAASRLLPTAGAAGSEEKEVTGRRLAFRAGIVDVGACLTVASVFLWFVFSLSNAGMLFFLGSYLTYLASTSLAPLPWVYLAMSLGVTFAALDLQRGTAKAAVVAFALFAVPAFLIGLRGEVLFPAVAVIGVLGCSHRLWRARVFWGVAALALIAISFVGQVRVQGVSNVSQVVSSPVGAIEEMGYSIRPLVASVRWHEYGQQPYLHGATYLAPVDRQLRGLLGLPVPPALDDERLMNVEISRREGAIGGSVIAEAHHNGGLVGVGAVMMVVGALMGLIFRHPRSPLGVALSGLVAVLVLMHIRNSFAPLPAWAAAGIGIVGAAYLLGLLRSTHGRGRRSMGPR
ncbi:O-antigen polysaccharide polymerase Wzy [Auraticoccus monumenti]|uniref:O-antigen polysaccharide polymerase Wzy n=1 Tax=Auraticoccus monumenti TaxID=675864 RepID=UPI0012F8C8AD|nr:O-antigen polysaccharide polymerase Wzy [Auraticoccus monumenti]